MNKQLYLPGFRLSTLRRKPCSARQRFEVEKARLRHHSISQLGECFGKFIPSSELESARHGTFSRRRLFSKENTFWGFFSQTLDADGGCQEVVRKIQSVAAARSMPIPAKSTSAYCQARKKLDEACLENIFNHTAKRLQNQGRNRWWKERRVVVVDATGVSMADTPRIRRTGLSPVVRNLAAAFRKGEYVPVSACKPVPC